MHSTHTLEYIVNTCYQLYWANGKSFASMWTNTREVLSFFGEGFNPRNFTLKSVEQFIFYLRKKGNSPATINRKLSVLSKIMTYCENHRILESKPKVPFQKENNSRIRWVTPEEEERILQYFQEKGDSDMELFCLFGIYTGMRCSEILALEPRDIDLENQVIHVHESKSGSPRVIPIATKLYKKVNHLAEGLFVNLCQDRVNYLWNKMKGELGLSGDKEFTPHCLRHTFCSRLAQKGVNVAVLQALAGHRTTSMTLRYIHLNTDALQVAIGYL